MYGILIYDGVEPIDIGATFGVLSMASRIVPDLNFSGIARHAGPVSCAGGLKVIADYSVEAPPPYMTELMVTGGPGWTEVVKDGAILDFVRDTTADLTAICTGAMILQAAGRLDGKSATTKSRVFDGERSPFDVLATSVTTEDAAIVDDNGILTTGGVTLGIDGVFYSLARRYGQPVADEVARVMEYSRALDANREAMGYR